MRRDLGVLADGEFDLLVVGGGIFGACAARDAALRGLSVALVEREDFGGATSANSFKVVHGGIRYLQHADFHRVRQSSADRRTLLRVAPHLVRPLPIVVPTYGHGMRGKELLRLAMAAYDAATFDRNQGVTDPGRRIPRGRTLSRAQVLERFPGVAEKGLTGAGVFHDGHVYNPPRLVLAFIQSAVEAGAVAANYVEATALIRRDGGIAGVEARDDESGDLFEIRARVVLNAAGPWAEQVLERSLGRGLDPTTPWSRDAYFVVGRALVPGREALALQSITHDPDAVLSRGARHLFIAPWHGASLVGVWHTVYRGDPDDFTVTGEELQTFVDEINAAYTELGLTIDEITRWNAGLVPFGENEPGARDLRYGHRSRLVDHARERDLGGLITLIGVRYTTGPSDAAKAVDMALRKLGREGPPNASHEAPVRGGSVEDFDMLVRQALNQGRVETPEEALRALIHNHGAEFGRVLDLTKERPSLGLAVTGSTVLRAEVVYAIRHEMARTLSDVVLRRTDLGTAGWPGRDALEECLSLAAQEAGWGADRARRELEGVDGHYPAGIRERAEGRRPT
jgi:glycerol-3-phosphate dehydrogenase